MTTGALVKLKIEAFKDIRLQTPASDGVFTVMFNPAAYSLNYEVEYNAAQGQGSTGSPQVFNRIKPQEYNFDFIIDGTGVSSEQKVVADEVKRFLRITEETDGEIHRPYYLKISWGSLTVNCVLKSAEINYNLFKPNGYPLRAKITAAFSELVDDARRVRRDNLTSPDLTHHRVVKQGDTLPLMTHRIYGKPDYYLEVARFNGLLHFRDLEVGSTLLFPPLKQGKAG